MGGCLQSILLIPDALDWECVAVSCDKQSNDDLVMMIRVGIFADQNWNKAVVVRTLRLSVCERVYDRIT